MKYRILGKTGFKISEISMGTWQVGGRWGSKFDPDLAESILKKAIDGGVNFLDTADVYSDGESEKAVGRIIKKNGKRIYVADWYNNNVDVIDADSFRIIKTIAGSRIIQICFDCASWSYKNRRSIIFKAISINFQCYCFT